MAAEAFVTCALDDPSAFGCMVVAHGVRKHGSTRTLVVLVSQHVTQPVRQLLFEIFDDVVQVPSIDCSNWTVPIRDELWQTFLKIHVWRLVQFKKCVFLDADTLVLDNCDELFEREELSAAPDVGWPDNFNSGVFVFTPAFATYDAIIRLAATGTSFDGTEQGLLNTYFCGWRSDIRFRLPFIYNMVANVSYSYAPAFQRFGTMGKIVHFVDHWKPWDVQWSTHTLSSVHQGPGGPFFPVWLDIFRNQVIPKLTEGCRHFLATRKFASVSSLASHIRYTESLESSWVHENHQGPFPADAAVDSTQKPYYETTPTNWQPPVISHWEHPLLEQREPEPAPSQSQISQNQSQIQIQSWIPEDSGPKTPPPSTPITHTPTTPTPTIQQPHQIHTSWQLPHSEQEPHIQEHQEVSHGDGQHTDDHHRPQEVTPLPLPPVHSSPAPPAFQDPSPEPNPDNMCIEDEAKGDDQWERMLAWEQGKIDYLGKDNFENVLRRLEASILGLEEVPEAPASIPVTKVSEVLEEPDDLSGPFEGLSVEPEASNDESSKPVAGYQVGDFTGMKEWEDGNFDIEGRDSSDNIMRRLQFLLGGSVTDTDAKDEI